MSKTELLIGDFVKTKVIHGGRSTRPSLPSEEVEKCKNSQKEKPISQPIHVISDIGNIKSRFDASKDSKFVAVKVQEDTQKVQS